MKKQLIYILFSLLSACLMAYSWPGTGNLEYLIFFSFIPLLFVERKISADKIRFKSGTVFLYAYLTFLIFNLITTYWIKFASPGGMILANVFNTLFMSLVFLLFHFTRRFINDKVGYLSLIFYWVGFEYLHINWELSWIWLNLGNVFANRIEWIQWYEYTGALGGTIWILSVNVLLFYGITRLKYRFEEKRIFLTRIMLFFALISVPFIISKVIFKNYVEDENEVEIVLVQPNIDPYNEKFGTMNEYDQIDRLIKLSEKMVTSNTELVFAPETAFPLGYWEHELDHIYGTEKVDELLERHPKVKYIVGLSTIRLYVKGEGSSPTARMFNDGSGNSYDYYNSVIQEEKGKERQLYHKSRLVLGVEKMPFLSKFKFLDNLAISLGGASGSLGTEKSPLVFNSETSSGEKIRIIPAICYESIYGEYLTEFAKLGGNILGVITNDGWWGNTSGYEQHFSYSRLRAIELRRSVARSANTGISAFINQKGEILQKSEWWVQDSLRGTLNLNNKLTFYSRHGDYLGRLASFFSVLLVVWLVVKSIKHKSSIKTI